MNFSVRRCLGKYISLQMTSCTITKIRSLKEGLLEIETALNSVLIIIQRFQKGDMYHLKEALEIQENYICSQRTIATRMEVLTILLRRFSYPNRWCDLLPVFGRSDSEFSLICDLNNMV